MVTRRKQRRQNLHPYALYRQFNSRYRRIDDLDRADPDRCRHVYGTMPTVTSIVYPDHNHHAAWYSTVRYRHHLQCRQCGRVMACSHKHHDEEQARQCGFEMLPGFIRRSPVPTVAMRKRHRFRTRPNYRKPPQSKRARVPR